MQIRGGPIAVFSQLSKNSVKFCQARRVCIRTPRHRHTVSFLDIRQITPLSRRARQWLSKLPICDRMLDWESEAALV
jgi:hypothetical protein